MSVGPNWVHWKPLGIASHLHREDDVAYAQSPEGRSQLEAEIEAALAGEAAKRQAYLDGEVTRCEHCGRTEGLKDAQNLGAYTVTACDCNYQHLRQTKKGFR